MTSAIELRIEPRDRPVGAGQVRRLLPHRTRRMVGPFMFADVIGPETLAPGSGWGVDSPVAGSSPLVLAEVMIDADSPVTVPSALPELAVVALGDDVRVNGETLSPGQLAVLRTDISATHSGSGRAVVLGGEPVGKRNIWWNLVHSDPDRIEQAKSDWAAQRFPEVPDDHDPFVPLPA